MSIIKVYKDNSGDYTRIQSAIDKAQSGDTILIGPGTFYEKIFIEKSNIRLIGSKSDETIITFDDYAFKAHVDGSNYGTFRSYTMFVGGSHVKLENLHIINSAGDGRQVGQGIALYCHGDYIEVNHCRLLGHQDTLFCGPLPKEPRIPNSFVGPGEHVEYKTSHQYYSDCYIEGDIDFIFGSGLALFHFCKIVSNNRSEKINGYVTAASTWEHEPFGFIFLNCDFYGKDHIDIGSVYLGRPWRPYAKTWFFECSFDNHIALQHFDTWDNEMNKETANYREYHCDYKSNNIPENNGNFIQINPKHNGLDKLNKWHISKIVSSN